MELGELVALWFGGAGPEKNEDKDFKVEWAEPYVLPVNSLRKQKNSTLLKIKVTKGSLTGPEANVVVLGADSAPALSAGIVGDVKFSGGNLQGADGKQASIAFEVKHGIWRQFDKLEYDFACVIDQVRRKTKKPLKVKRWHVQAVDMNPAEANAQLPFRKQEQKNFNKVFTGPDDERKSHSFVADSATRNDFGSWMMNTYSFVYTGHGCVLCRVCGNAYDSDDGTTDAEFGTWTDCSQDPTHMGAVSTFCVSGWATPPKLSFFHAKHVRDEKIVTVAPRYLVFSVACGGAFETSLFDSFISRGTRYGVGFEKSTRCDWARDYANSFFRKWVRTHKCDPKRIPEVFDGLQGAWGAKLSPSLFGRARCLGSRLRELGRKIGGCF